MDAALRLISLLFITAALCLAVMSWLSPGRSLNDKTWRTRNYAALMAVVFGVSSLVCYLLSLVLED